MVRISRIISQVAFAASCAIAIFVLAFGFKPHLEIQTILSQASILETFKNHFADFACTDDKEHPLVVQARLFALRIDPPIPPKKTTPQPPIDDSKTQPPVKPDDLERMLPKPPAEYTLIGTARYTGHPEKSLALLNLVSGGCKWVRQGEEINESTIGEIKDGKIVLYKGGTMHTDLFVPAPQSSSRPLLKN